MGWWEVIKGSFQKHLLTWDGQRKKLFAGGGGFEGVTTPAPRKILIIHVQHKGTPTSYSREKR